MNSTFLPEIKALVLESVAGTVSLRRFEDVESPARSVLNFKPPQPQPPACYLKGYIDRACNLSYRA